MKKKYIILPILFIIILIAIIIAVAISFQTDYIQKLSYDHVSDTVYNGVEIVGEDGLFYLAKDGKKVSHGYASLKSVNDYYGNIEKLIEDGKSVELFDYYIAHTVENSDYLLVNSEGEEVYISGDSYSLDTENTKLPFLIFTNNSNGLKSAISLNRLDSDISYKSGNELTLRPFKKITAERTCDNSANCAYLETEDIADIGQKSYFRADGIKITTGTDISVTTLFKENSPKTSYVCFYNSTEQIIVSANGELIAKDITSRYRVGEQDWQYTVSIDEQTAQNYITVFSPLKSFTLSSDDYYLNTFTQYGSCMSAVKKSTGKSELINLSGTTLGVYSSVMLEAETLKAQSSDGDFYYFDRNGNVIMRSNYSDMLAISELSDKEYTVFTSQLYNEANNSEYYHFAKADASLYTLNISNIEINKLSASHASFIIKKNDMYSIFTPFSVSKESDEYNSIKIHSQNGVLWCLAENYETGKMDMVDPLTSKSVFSINCSDEDFAKYRILHDSNTALALNSLDTDTAVHISIIKMEKYDTEDMLNSTRYFAIYRNAPIAHKEYSNASLNVLELGNNLKLDKPYRAYTSENYLIVYTSSHSNVFSLDESFMLSSTASIPYQIDRIISDIQDTDKDYFVVKTENEMEGLYNTNSEAVLTPYYNQIKQIEGEYITVSLRGAFGVIQIKNNGKTKSVIDFLYSDIISTGNGGYYTKMRNGQEDIFEKGKQVLTVNNVTVVHSYKADENGVITVSYWYLFSSDAKLYIHRSEQSVKLTFGDYERITQPDSETLNNRSVVIYYYSSSKLVHTQVIHPTDNITDIISSLYYQKEGQIWYTSDSGTESVTTEYLSKLHIIKLYSTN